MNNEWFSLLQRQAEIERELRETKAARLQGRIKIGQNLLKMKENMTEDEFQEGLQKIGIDMPKAQQYMKIAISASIGNAGEEVEDE
jgi:hypothetical protein